MLGVGAILCSVTLVASAHAQDTTAADTPSGEPGAVRRAIATLARDVKELKTKESLVILLNGAVLALLALPVDSEITRGASSTRFLKAGFGTTGKLLGEEHVQAGSAVAVYAAGWMFDRPRLARVGADLVEAQAVAAAVTQVLKLAAQRRRPDGEARSFPSGHASASFATAQVLHRHFGGKAAAPAYLAASYITMSRLQANSHYASDILVGAALGVAIGRAAALEVPGTRLRLTPGATNGGAAVMLTLR